MPMGIIQTPAIINYCGSDAFTEIPVFTETITQDRCEFITKLLHVVYSATKRKVGSSPSSVLDTQVFEL